MNLYARTSTSFLFFLTLLLFCCVHTTHAQYNADSPTPWCDTCYQRVAIGLRAYPYANNNEYSTFEKGTTDFGVLTQPTLEYYISPRANIYIGYYFIESPGKETFNTQPTFALTLMPTDSLTITMGNIYNPTAPNLEEAIIDPESNYFAPLGFGLQVQWTHTWLETDAWIDWQQVLSPGDPFQESFLVGHFTNFTLADVAAHHLTLRTNTLFFHRGGEIDSSDEPVFQAANSAIGLLYMHREEGQAGWGVSAMYHRYDELNRDVANHRGGAWYTRLHYEGEHLHGFVGYWYTMGFRSIEGPHIMQSVSSDQVDKPVSDRHRHLITAKAIYNRWLYDGLGIDLHAELYYDVERGEANISTGLMFWFDQAFFLF